jgi:hypothetical protein
MIAIDAAVLLAILAAIAYLGFLAGRSVGRREGAADEAAALKRSLLLDLQTRATLDPAFEPQFIELVRRLLMPPDQPGGR